MARNVMAATAGIAMIALALLAAAPARSMGPSAPFAAPNSGLPEQAAADAGIANVQGLAGVRLGRQAGAVIDGVWVAKGATVRGAKLETVTRSRVVLRYPDGHTESLDMFPLPGASTGAGADSGRAPALVPPSNEAPPK